MKKMIKIYLVLMISAILVTLNHNKLLYGGEIIRNARRGAFYEKLLLLDKRNNWELLTQQSERAAASYKEIFEIRSFDIKNIKKIDINLFTPQQWSSNNLNDYAFSPDGKEIAFVICGRDASFNTLYALYILDVDNGAIKNILSPKQFPEITSIIYSPDGENIYFVGKLEEIKETSNIPQFDSLCEVNLKTKEIRELIHYGIFTIYAQAISPDGKKITYENSNFDEISVYDLTTNESYALTKGKYPMWLPIGKKISYCGKDGNYYLINLDGSDNELFILNKPKQRVKLFGGIGRISGPLLWSPEGGYVYYNRISIPLFADVETYFAYIMDVSTKEEKKLPDALNGIKFWVGK